MRRSWKVATDEHWLPDQVSTKSRLTEGMRMIGGRLAKYWEGKEGPTRWVAEGTLQMHFFVSASDPHKGKETPTTTYQVV